MNSKVERNYGIDLLRIVSMFMVVVLHVLGAGGLLEATSGVNNKIVWFLEILSFCAVNCYGLISGYVGYKSKFKLTSIFVLWLQVFIYNLGIYLIFLLFGKLEFSFTVLKEMLFPVCSERYWYFTAYFALFFIMPILNFVLEKFEKKKLGNILVIFFVLFSVCSTIFNKDIFHLSNGYSMYWLIYLYLVGAYVGKYNIFNIFSKIKLISIYFILCTFTFIFKFCLIFFSKYIPSLYQYNMMFVNYISPTIFISSVCLLLLFSKINFSKIKKIIEFFSPISFGVYLLHVQPLVFERIWAFKFVCFAKINAISLIFIVLGLSFGIYLILALIDFVRSKLFLSLKIKERVTLFEKKYLKSFI